MASTITCGCEVEYPTDEHGVSLDVLLVLDPDTMANLKMGSFLEEYTAMGYPLVMFLAAHAESFVLIIPSFFCCNAIKI